MHREGWSFWLARCVLTSALLGATQAHALGLGKLTVHSGLDEALNAEIELSATSQDELNKLKATLASREEFENAGIERPVHLTGIKYTVGRRTDGRPVLKLTSDQPMREPFLHFLLQIDASGARMVREYTALLDPPHLIASKSENITAPIADPVRIETDTAPASTPAAQPPVSNAETPPVSEPAPATVPAAPASANTGAAHTDEALLGPGANDNNTAAVTTQPTPAVEADARTTGATAANEPSSYPSAAAPTQYGPVRPGETLSKITRQLQIDRDLAPEQVMLALLKANKSAFFHDNVNNLKAGKILTIPAREDIAASPRTQALKEFRAQYSAWQEYKVKLAGTAQVVTVASDDKNTVTGEITKTAPPAEKTAKSAAPGNTKAGNNDLLKIVRANPDAKEPSKNGHDANLERQKLVERASTLEEAITSKELENKELRERVTQLEAQVKNAKRLIELENKDLAKIQQQGDKNKANTATVKTETPKPEAATLPAKPAENAAPVASAPVAPPATTEAPKPAPVVPPVGTVTKPAPAPVPVALPAEPEGFFAGMLKGLSENELIVPALGGIAVIAIGGFLLYYRRRRQAIAEFGESILAGGGLNANSEGAANPEANAGEVSFLSDFSQGGMGNIHTDEVDPIAEAEVYLAYGRDEQAEEILKEAVVKDPNRQELKLKLLEIYHQRNDLAAFETVAEELYAALEGKGGKVWERAEEMGRKMSPDNPLFRGAGPSAVAMGTAAGVSAASVSSDTLADFGAQFSLDDPQPASDNAGASPQQGQDEGSEFSFDLDFAPPEKPKAEVPVSAPARSDASDSGGIDFDFNSLLLDQPEPAGGAAPLADTGADFSANFDAASTGGSADEISFEAAPLGDDMTDIGDDARIDETATKLDLAKAYIDMGDADGARSILDEVLAEGTDVQRKQAAELARQIAA